MQNISEKFPDAHVSRRTILWGLFAFFWGGIGSVLDAAPALEHHLRENRDANMADGVKRFQVVDSAGTLAANFFTLENGKDVRLELISTGSVYSPDGNIGASFAKEIAKQGRQPALIAAGPFFNKQQSVEGCFVQNGVIRNAQFARQGGYVLFWPQWIIELGEIPTSPEEQAKLLARAVQNKATLFQQFILFPEKKKQTIRTQEKENKFRFLVKRHAADGSITSGILVFTTSKTIDDSLEIMKQIGIKTALYLDTAATERVTFFDKNGKEFHLGDKYQHQNGLVITVPKK